MLPVALGFEFGEIRSQCENEQKCRWGLQKVVHPEHPERWNGYFLSCSGFEIAFPFKRKALWLHLKTMLRVHLFRRRVKIGNSVPLWLQCWGVAGLGLGRR